VAFKNYSRWWIRGWSGGVCMKISVLQRDILRVRFQSDSVDRIMNRRVIFLTDSQQTEEQCAIRMLTIFKTFVRQLPGNSISCESRYHGNPPQRRAQMKKERVKKSPVPSQPPQRDSSYCTRLKGIRRRGGRAASQLSMDVE
jgi:hypothetical protein